MPAHILKGKKIVLAITGSIAAYKAAYLTRILTKSGAEVQILMTEAATQFISTLTMSTLSKRKVFIQIMDESGWNNHVEMGLWADLFLIAPCTANSLANIATGSVNDIVSAVYLSARCPVAIAPAMDVDMWHHPATQRNIATVENDGVKVIPVAHGELASGLVGEGRMAEPEKIVEYVISLIGTQSSVLNGKKALVTAGPTYERMDPVRFIGNYSSGKMGIVIAEELYLRGVHTILILGPSQLKPRFSDIQVVSVNSAHEMYEAAKLHYQKSDIAVLAAAVSDYRPAEIKDQKIKKKEHSLTIKLEKTPDIATELGKIKTKDQINIGFALETTNEFEHANKKLVTKNFDFIVLNSLNDPGAGFNYDTNQVQFIFQDNKHKSFELKSKQLVAVDIVDEIEKLIA